MSEKTLPEQARFLAKFVEEKEYDEWPWADYEIAQMLEDMAAEIESESKAADELRRERDELLAALKSMIDRWRHEASRLDREAVELARNCRDADAARRLAEAKLRRALAGELERMLEGEK